MPANLTPKYLKAESAYREASTAEERLACLQWMLQEIPKHKGTDRLQGEIKSKIAKLKMEIERGPAGSSKTINRIPRQGAGRVVLLGAPNVGKSQLLASLTGASPVVADYPFSTHQPQPGMMMMEDCPIQLIDTPPIATSQIDVGMMDLVRTAQLLLLVVDLASDTLVEDTQLVLQSFQGKTLLGRYTGPVPKKTGVMSIHCVLVFNKSDSTESKRRQDAFMEMMALDFDSISVSALKNHSLDSLRKMAFDCLRVVRVYTKKSADKTLVRRDPILIQEGETLSHVASQVHDRLAHTLRDARVWNLGSDAPIIVKPDYLPRDGDLVELHGALDG